MESTYLQIKEKALPIIKAYRDDLLKHDKASITQNSQQEIPSPFLHFTGDTGTYLVFFVASNNYPAAGEIVPYLFGHANRYHILNEKLSTVHCMPKVNRQDLILYFDGKNPVKEITQTKAENLVADYQEKILQEWRK